MASDTINVFLTSFPGLGLPRTLSLPISATTPIKDLWQRIADRLPQPNHRFILTTVSNKGLNVSSDLPVESFLSDKDDTFLALRLTVPLCGGKGGFGSQLRAAGGRMSSKRKKNQGDANSSNRNLDGRRLRTINEAKSLAEYLALKPDMEKKEKEARRKRWEQVIESTERKEEEVRNGSKGRVDSQWVDDKDEAGEKARAAVSSAMNSDQYRDNLQSHASSVTTLGSVTGVDEDKGHINTISACLSRRPPLRTFDGFEDDNEFMSDTEDEDNGGAEETIVIGTCKGKARA